MRWHDSRLLCFWLSGAWLSPRRRSRSPTSLLHHRACESSSLLTASCGMPQSRLASCDAPACVAGARLAVRTYRRSGAAEIGRFDVVATGGYTANDTDSVVQGNDCAKANVSSLLIKPSLLVASTKVASTNFVDVSTTRSEGLLLPVSKFCEICACKQRHARARERELELSYDLHAGPEN